MAAAHPSKLKCPRCTNNTIPDGKNRCTSCGFWNWGVTVTNEPGDGSILLEDITSSNVDRMITGPWDGCFGCVENEDGTDGPAGIVRGSSNMIGGSPGAGKSTLFLQMAMGVITNYKLPVLYLSAEEQLPQIKARAERLKITGSRLLRFIDMRKGSADLGAVLKKYQFGMLILDSLRAITETDEGAIMVCKIVKEFATMQHAPAMISQHVTKGDEIAGLMALQHEVDATLTFFPDPERVDPESGEAPRMLETQKNRNGKAFVSVEFNMTKRGLVLNTNDDEEEDEEDENE
jgi:DNA repair protein RadA/Sms